MKRSGGQLHSFTNELSKKAIQGSFRNQHLDNICAKPTIAQFTLAEDEHFYKSVCQGIFIGRTPSMWKSSLFLLSSFVPLRKLVQHFVADYITTLLRSSVEQGLNQGLTASLSPLPSLVDAQLRFTARKFSGRHLSVCLRASAPIEHSSSQCFCILLALCVLVLRSSTTRVEPE